MSTKIRPVISKNKSDYISKHRYYELKHFVMQYNELDEERRRMILQAADEADAVLAKYIIEGVIFDLSYDCLRARYKLPCCKDYYYNAYRRFFKRLSWVRK